MVDTESLMLLVIFCGRWMQQQSSRNCTKLWSHCTVRKAGGASTQWYCLEQFPEIMRNVQRSRNRRAALPALTGVGPPASSAFPCAPCPCFLFLIISRNCSNVKIKVCFPLADILKESAYIAINTNRA